MPNGKIVYAAFNDKSQSLWTIDAGGVKRRITPDGSTDFDPSVTADGQTVVFNSNRSGAFEVWRVNADGSDLRQLTFGSYNEMPSVSPDGKWVVYSSTRSGLATLWRIPRVSPDSRLIACSYQDGTKLAVFSIDGGAPLKIFDLPKTANLRYGLRWTPDGAYVTYRDWENGYYWRQSLAGGAPQRIEGLPAEKLFSFGWSPDGKRFAYSRGAQIHDLVLIQNSR
jgi:Tol biopolymer transport system component